MQQDIKRHTASLRHALSQCENDAAHIIQDIEVNVSKKYTKPAEKMEFNEIGKHIGTTVNHWRRTSTLAVEGFAELTQQIAAEKNRVNEYESALIGCDDELHDIWVYNSQMQAAITYVERLLAKEDNT